MATSMAGARSWRSNGLTTYPCTPASLASSISSRWEKAVTSTTAVRRSDEISLAAEMPSMPGILMSSKRDVGGVLTDQGNRFVATTALGDDLVALLLQQLPQVHPDDRFVLCDDDSGRHRCLPRSVATRGPNSWFER